MVLNGKRRLVPSIKYIHIYYGYTRSYIIATAFSTPAYRTFPLCHSYSNALICEYYNTVSYAPRHRCPKGPFRDCHTDVPPTWKGWTHTPFTTPPISMDQLLSENGLLTLGTPTRFNGLIIQMFARHCFFLLGSSTLCPSGMVEGM